MSILLNGWRGPVAWGLLILGITLLPAPAVPSLGILGRYHIDKLVHAFLFAVLFLFLFRAFRKQAGASLERWQALLPSILIAIVYGAITEVLQEVTGGGRSGDPLDFLADTVGVLLATALLYWGAGTRTYLGKHLDRYF